jgi:peptidoglycan/LPS O-acetylase OafA/YrhL
MSASSRIFGLDLLRAIAILLVCFLHGRELIHQYFPDFPQFWFVDGVDLFFSLSGFLIGGIFIKAYGDQRRLSLKDIYNFWIRRWFRTLPNYYLILFINIALQFYWSGGKVVSNIWKYFFFLQNLTFLDSLNFFGETWSLCVEEWFYLIFPLTCIAFSLLSKGKFSRVILVCTLFIILFSMTLRNFTINGMQELGLFDWVHGFRTVVIYRFDSIVYGVLGAYLSIFYNEIWLKFRYVLFGLGVLGIYFLALHYGLDTNVKKANYDFISSMSILALLPLLSNWKKCKLKFLEKGVIFISKISYSMYLVNATLIMSLISRYFPVNDAESAVRGYVIFWVLTLVLSYIIYSFYEKPTTALREKFAIS